MAKSIWSCCNLLSMWSSVPLGGVFRWFYLIIILLAVLAGPGQITGVIALRLQQRSPRLIGRGDLQRDDPVSFRAEFYRWSVSEEKYAFLPTKYGNLFYRYQHFDPSPTTPVTRHSKNRSEDPASYATSLSRSTAETGWGVDHTRPASGGATERAGCRLGTSVQVATPLKNVSSSLVEELQVGEDSRNPECGGDSGLMDPSNSASITQSGVSTPVTSSSRQYPATAATPANPTNPETVADSFKFRATPAAPDFLNATTGLTSNDLLRTLAGSVSRNVLPHVHEPETYNFSTIVPTVSVPSGSSPCGSCPCGGMNASMMYAPAYENSRNMQHQSHDGLPHDVVQTVPHKTAPKAAATAPTTQLRHGAATVKIPSLDLSGTATVFGEGAGAAANHATNTARSAAATAGNGGTTLRLPDGALGIEVTPGGWGRGAKELVSAEVVDEIRLDSRTGRFQLPDGGRLILFFTHGNPGSSEEFDQVINEFVSSYRNFKESADLPFTWIAMDLFGQGRSQNAKLSGDEEYVSVEKHAEFAKEIAKIVLKDSETKKVKTTCSSAAAAGYSCSAMMTMTSSAHPSTSRTPSSKLLRQRRGRSATTNPAITSCTPPNQRHAHSSSPLCAMMKSTCNYHDYNTSTYNHPAERNYMQTAANKQDEDSFSSPQSTAGGGMTTGKTTAATTEVDFCGTTTGGGVSHNYHEADPVTGQGIFRSSGPGCTAGVTSGQNLYSPLANHEDKAELGPGSWLNDVADSTPGSALFSFSATTMHSAQGGPAIDHRPLRGFVIPIGSLTGTGVALSLAYQLLIGRTSEQVPLSARKLLRSANEVELELFTTVLHAPVYYMSTRIREAVEDHASSSRDWTPDRKGDFLMRMWKNPSYLPNPQHPLSDEIRTTAMRDMLRAAKTQWQAVAAHLVYQEKHFLYHLTAVSRLAETSGQGNACVIWGDHMLHDPFWAKNWMIQESAQLISSTSRTEPILIPGGTEASLSEEPLLAALAILGHIGKRLEHSAALNIRKKNK
ncbi:unnamed protein product [Amoebophrya sp. A25]|nr:unnamed protein product [Amoebophrya sp. A25]|eukprot:GSA25T00012109001.1